MEIRKPFVKDLPRIEQILNQWTEQSEVEKYLARISDEISGKVEYNTRFWVICNNDIVVGLGGLSDTLPKVLHLAKTENSIEIKVLYLDNELRGKGYGAELLRFLEDESLKTGHKEVIIRSAIRYRDSAYGFYRHKGYDLVGYVDGDMAVFRKMLN